jgi:dCMP deaminase
MRDIRERDSMLMDVARRFAMRSTCSRLNVGAVASREGRILSTGYNGAPSGMEHCHHEVVEGMFDEVHPGCKNAVHAEANAVAFAAKHGVPLLGAELHTTHSPCMTCAFLLINAGFSAVIYEKAYRDTEPLSVLKQAGVVVLPL